MSIKQKTLKKILLSINFSFDNPISPMALNGSYTRSHHLPPHHPLLTFYYLYSYYDEGVSRPSS